MHSTLLRSSPTKHAYVSEQNGPLQPLSLRDMEAKQHPIKSLKSYPETGGRSLAAAAGGGDSGGYRGGSADMDMEAKIQKAIDFKVEGHRCYKEKKFREAIGKYHRALLQLKGVHVVDGTTGSEVNLLNQAAAKLTEEQRSAVESTEIECYDSLTGNNNKMFGITVAGVNTHIVVVHWVHVKVGIVILCVSKITFHIVFYSLQGFIKNLLQGAFRQCNSRSCLMTDIS